MKLKDGFITHEGIDEHITVTSGNTAFNGMIRSNKTAGFIVECLKSNITREEIIARMLEKYDAPKEQIEKDVDKILTQLVKTGAIDE